MRKFHNYSILIKTRNTLERSVLYQGHYSFHEDKIYVHLCPWISISIAIFLNPYPIWIGNYVKKKKVQFLTHGHKKFNNYMCSKTLKRVDSFIICARESILPFRWVLPKSTHCPIQIMGLVLWVGWQSTVMRDSLSNNLKVSCVNNPRCVSIHQLI